jgi:hypothetical protein
MTRDQFWNLIETARRGARDEFDMCENLSRLLGSKSTEEIRGFEEHRCRLMEESYNWNLWGAAYLINAGCSDDGFEYFRGWLFTQGRSVFEKALERPDSLADHVSDEVECEDFLYVALSAYEEVTDHPLEDVVVELPELRDSWDFDDENEMRARYPRLCEVFLDD